VRNNLKHGANVHFKSRAGWTALKMAETYGLGDLINQDDIKEMLVKAGAD
jgi:hypothetical protein